MSFKTDEAKGKAGTKKFIAPVLCKIFGGTVTQTERRANSFERSLDLNCIDGLVATDKGVLPFAARIQSGVKYESFSIRYSRPSGAPTEFEKISKAIEMDLLRPLYHAQGYVADDGQATVAVVRTQDLFNFVKKNINKVIIKANEDGTKLLAAFWRDLEQFGVTLKKFLVSSEGNIQQI